MDQTGSDMNKGKGCDCHHHKVGPIAVILIGLVVLLGGFGVFSFQAESIIAAILILVIGFTRLFEHKCGCCNS